MSGVSGDRLEEQELAGWLDETLPPTEAEWEHLRDTIRSLLSRLEAAEEQVAALEGIQEGRHAGLVTKQWKENCNYWHARAEAAEADARQLREAVAEYLDAIDSWDGIARDDGLRVALARALDTIGKREANA